MAPSAEQSIGFAGEQRLFVIEPHGLEARFFQQLVQLADAGGPKSRFNDDARFDQRYGDAVSAGP